MGAAESSMDFRERVKKLMTTPISPDDHAFWKSIFVAPLSVEDVFTFIMPVDVRYLRRDQIGNLAMLLFKSIEQLFLFVRSGEVKTDFASARNSLRILGRILPFVLENGLFTDPFMDPVPGSQNFFAAAAAAASQPPPSPSTAASSSSASSSSASSSSETSSAPPEGWYDFVNDFFWRNRVQCPASTPIAGESPKKEGRETITVVFETIGDVPLEQPLGSLLASMLLEVAFYPGFTQPAPPKGADSGNAPLYPGLDLRLLWAGGIAAPETKYTSSYEMEEHRMDVLRCIVSVCTGSLYERNPLAKNPFIDALAVVPSTTYGVTLVYSMLNIAMSYNPAGILPFTSYWGVSQETLVTSCLHSLLILMDYSHFQYASGGSAQPLVTDASGSNCVWAIVKSICMDSDLDFLFRGFVRLLGNAVLADNTYLPNSQKVLDCQAELLLLLWKMIDVNKAFVRRICKHLDINELLVPLLYMMHKLHTDNTKFGVLQVVTFIVLSLSGERDFGVALNKPFAQNLPMSLPLFTGNHIDLLVVCLTHLIFANKPWCRSLYDCWLTTIANISPYCKSLSPIACSKLVGLFEVLSSQKALMKPEGARGVNLLILLLDTFNNLIQYQYEGSVYLVYGIIRQKILFTNFASLLRTKGDTPDKDVRGHLGEELCDRVPLGTILQLISSCAADVENYILTRKILNDVEVVEYLKRTTMVGLLPVPHPILIRRFESQAHTHGWVTTWTWGTIFLHTTHPPLLDSGSITLFKISFTPRPTSVAAAAAAQQKEQDLKAAASSASASATTPGPALSAQSGKTAPTPQPVAKK